MNLVKVEVVIESSPDRSEDEEYARIHVAELEAKLTRITTQIGSLATQIGLMETALQNTFPEQNAELEALAAELAEMEAAEAEKRAKITRSSSEDREDPDDQKGSYTGQGGVEELNASVHKSSEVRKLFKKISMKTHPDRNQSRSEQDKKLLYELFLEAKAAFNVNDLQGLREVWEAVRQMRPRWFNRLMARAKALEFDIRRANGELKSIKNSSPYIMSIDYQKPESKSNVESFYLRILDKRISDVKSKIRSLKAADEYQAKWFSFLNTP